MRTITVKDLMIPLSEYATVHEDATLYEAVLALEKAQEQFDPKRHRHRAILVLDGDKKVVGKLSMLDVVKSLEPKYAEMGDIGPLSRGGFSPQFLKSMLERFALWDQPLLDICAKAARVKVKDFMYTPAEGEYVDEKASLGEAVHMLVMGHHQSLLVTRDKEIVGILRLADLFEEICRSIKTCEL